MMKKFFILMSLVFMILACSNNNSLITQASEVKWQKAENYYNEKKYNKAIPYYRQLIFEKNSMYTADAQYKLGECYFNTKKYSDAIFEYQELLRLFPENRLAPDAQFKIANSYANLSFSPHYTQEETRKAIENYTIFIEKYPSDKRIKDAYQGISDMQVKLIEKTYLNGYIYFKMKDYSAALLYLDDIIYLANHNELEKKSLYYSALIHIDRKDKEPSLNTYNQLKEYFPDSKETKKIEKKIKKFN
ncbi:MAG: outer membrane protein assembly factor BamD [Candidatus Cloacimonetes bacterium]|nr:outer membrane protein assembly factor BamD [Candidatus Cloacimonadota bacterium]